MRDAKVMTKSVEKFATTTISVMMMIVTESDLDVTTDAITAEAAIATDTTIGVMTDATATAVMGDIRQTALRACLVRQNLCTNVSFSVKYCTERYFH